MGRLYHMGTCVRNMVRGEAENFNAGGVWEFGDSFCKLLLLYLLVFFLRKLCCLEAGQFAQNPLKYAALQRLFKCRISKVLAGTPCNEGFQRPFQNAISTDGG